MPNHKKYIDNLETERYRLSQDVPKIKPNQTKSIKSNYKSTIFDCLMYKFNQDPQRHVGFAIIAGIEV